MIKFAGTQFFLVVLFFDNCFNRFEGSPNHLFLFFNRRANSGCLFSDPGPERGDLPDDYVPVGMDETSITHPHIGLRNSGDYTCQANSSFGIVSKTVKVNG